MAIARGFVLVGLVAVAMLSVGCTAGDAAQGSSDGQTQVQEADFSLSLPGQWTEQATSNTNVWQYVRADEGLYLSVSVYNRLTADTTLEIYVEAAMKADRQVSSTVVLTAPTYEDRDGSRVAHYTGTDPANGRRLASDVYHNGSAFVQLYLEGYVSDSEQEINATLAQIAASLKIRS